MTKWDRALTVALLLAAVLSFLVVPGVVGARGTGAVVEIKVGGQGPRLIPLDKNALIDIAGKGGKCRLEIKSGRARVVYSNCPKHLCVAQGWISGEGQSIICLPHTTVISIESGQTGAGIVDAVVR